MNGDHECEPEEVCAGLMVTLYLDLIRPLCPQHNEQMLRQLMQQHAQPIAAHMVSAGITAAAQLFNAAGGSS
ncbi:MAG: hypothetical protein H0X11_11695 [Betaproteobacteria bacterium]|nr:hypothetical protein [Betaproteobacteria bacterium]